MTTEQGAHHHHHDHDHSDGHDHGHTHAGENPHAGKGSAVLLDIGGDVGAVVVVMPASMDGQEVEIRPLDRPAPHHLPHVAVVPRPIEDVLVPSLVFPEVVEGRYALCHKGEDEALLTVEVRGGEVTFAEWPGVG